MANSVGLKSKRFIPLLFGIGSIGIVIMSFLMYELILIVFFFGFLFQTISIYADVIGIKSSSRKLDGAKGLCVVGALFYWMLGIMVVVKESFTTQSFIIYFAIEIIILGGVRFLDGMCNKDDVKPFRINLLVQGILAFSLSILIFLFSSNEGTFSLALISFCLFLGALSDIVYTVLWKKPESILAIENRMVKEKAKSKDRVEKSQKEAEDKKHNKDRGC